MRQCRFIQLFYIIWPLAAGFDTHDNSLALSLKEIDTWTNTAMDNLRVRSPIDFHQVIMNCLLCGSNSIILLSDANIYVDSMTNYLTRHAIIFAHWDQNNATYEKDEVESNLTKSYTLYPKTTSVVLLHRPDLLLNIIDVIAEDRKRGNLSLMRHQTQWLVVIWSDEQMEQLKAQMRYSVLDNVAVIHICNKNNGIISVDKMATFMWRSNQTREAQEFNLDFSDERCVVFPNKKFGMNGRVIETVVKLFFETLLTIRENPQTKVYEYHGKTIDILSIMAKKLNFSYEIWPPAERRVFTRWQEYGAMISNGSFDVGLNVWSFLYGELGPYSVTYPINFDVITGLYRNPEESDRETSIFLLFPFPRIIYLCIGMTIIGTAILYMATRPSDPLENSSRQRDSQNISKKNINLQHFFAILGKLMASVINQNYLPNPTNMSSRILLGCWSLTIVILYALDTGFITAAMVKQDVHHPFTTFEELINRDDYKTGTIENTIVSRVMNKSRPGVLGYLGNSVERISVDETQTAGEIVETSMSSTEGKFVLIYYEMALREWLKKQDSPKRYTIMDQYLIDSSAGLLLQKGSDFALLLSHQIMRMHETGLLSEDHRRSGSRQKNIHDGDNENIAKKALNLNDFFWPFIWVVHLLALAIIALLTEVVIVRYTLKGTYKLDSLRYSPPASTDTSREVQPP